MIIDEEFPSLEKLDTTPLEWIYHGDFITDASVVIDLPGVFHITGNLYADEIQSSYTSEDDSNIEIKVGGNIIVKKNIDVCGDISAGGDIKAGGDIRAYSDIVGGDISAGGDISVGGDIRAYFDIVGGDIKAGGDIEAGEDIVCPGQLTGTVRHGRLIITKDK